MTDLDTPPLRSRSDRVWRDVDGAIFSASAVLHHHDEAARVHVVGDLGPSTAPVLRRMLDGLVADGISTIVVDMSELRLCTSHGVDVLEDARSRLAARGGSLTVDHAHGVVRKVLDLASESGDAERRIEGHR